MAIKQWVRWGVVLHGLGAISMAQAMSLNERLELQGLVFTVQSENTASQNTLRILPKGLQRENRPIVQQIDGVATAAEIADLNADGSPEVYVYVMSAGSGSYGSVVAYSSNFKKSLTPIYLPPLTDNREASQGYMGHDEFAVVENRLARRFPVYRAGDTNGAPTGGHRQVNYALVAGEAGWMLQIADWYEFDPDLEETMVVEPIIR